MSESIGNSQGDMTGSGNIDTKHMQITSHTSFSAPYLSDATGAGGAVQSRPDIIRNFNWNCNKRLKLFNVTPSGTAGAAAAANDWYLAPINEPRGLMPVAIIICTNTADHTEASAYLPQVTFDTTAHWNDL